MESKATAAVGGIFNIQIKDANGNVRDEFACENLVVDDGLDYILNAAFAAGATAQISSWYLGLINDQHTPAAASTMANVGAGSVEVTAYTPASHPAYTPNGATTAQTISNSDNAATFTITADSTAVRGLFVTDQSAQGATTGLLLAAAQFPADKILNTNEELVATYTFAAANA